MWAYYLAYLLSLIRLPFALIPYIVKLFVYFCLKDSFVSFWGSRLVQLIRITGDFFNFFIVSLLLLEIYKLMNFGAILGLLILFTEAVRLTTEKGVMLLSAFWQIIPHRAIAQRLSRKKQPRILKTYTSYYLLSDEERLSATLHRLKAKARFSKKTQTILKLRYVNSFQIVPNTIDLRAGKVRNIAQGIIYVHSSWANTPDLLCGQALRRSPWIFDPRYLRRPFYYRTEANRLMTLFVFENARLCPLFAIYQFGHEIKSARFDAFFQVARWLGYELEKPVQADGTYNFDPFVKTMISSRLKSSNNDFQPLWTDDEVLNQIANGPTLSALEIAEKYTYPLIYVREVLLSKLST